MKNLADLKRRCTPGTVLEVTRLKFKPASYFAVIATNSASSLGLVTTDRAEVGYTAWQSPRTWQLTEDTATKMSLDDEPEGLLKLRFLSEGELAAALPVDVRALAQQYQPETTPSAVVIETATVDVVTVTVESTTADMTEALFWEAQQSLYAALLKLCETAILLNTTLNVPCVNWQTLDTNTRLRHVALQNVTTNGDGEFGTSLVVRLSDALYFYPLSGNFGTPQLRRFWLSDCIHVEPFKVQTQRGTFERLRNGKYTNGAATYDSLLELSKHHSWVPLKHDREATGTLEHHGSYTPATEAQKAARTRPIAETDTETNTETAITEAQFWDAQKAVRRCLLELIEKALVRDACFNLSTIKFVDHPQIEVRDVQVNVNGDCQATLVVHQPEALWFYELTGDLHTFHPERLSLAAATERRVRRVLDSATVPMALRAILKGIQQLPTNELQVHALMLLDADTQTFLVRYAQTPFLIDLAAWLQGQEIRVEPQQVRTTDGFTLERQPDGSYSDGDLTYESLLDLDREHDWEEMN